MGNDTKVRLLVEHWKDCLLRFPERKGKDEVLSVEYKNQVFGLQQRTYTYSRKGHSTIFISLTIDQPLSPSSFFCFSFLLRLDKQKKAGTRQWVSQSLVILCTMTSQEPRRIQPTTTSINSTFSTGCQLPRQGNTTTSSPSLSASAYLLSTVPCLL